MMVETFLPAMRAMVARRLHDEGFSQSRIASLLGITQASVSLYVSQDRENQVRALSRLGVTSEEGERYCSLLSEDLKKNQVYAVSTLYSIWSHLLGRGLLCSAHRTKYPFLAQCDICMRAFGAGRWEGSEAVEAVARAVTMIESSSVFVHVMPEVSVNIAYAFGEASKVDDIVAIPGRIVRVRDRARAFMKPEFGASTHLAKMLLQIRVRMKERKAAMNLRYDERMEEVVSKLGLKTLRIGGEYSRAEDPVVEALARRMREVHESFDSVIASGGSGIEPSLYLFANNPTEIVELALRMAGLYSIDRY